MATLKKLKTGVIYFTLVCLILFISDMSIAIRVMIVLKESIDPNEKERVNCDWGFWGDLPYWFYAIYWLITRWLSSESAIYICFFLFMKPFALKHNTL